MEKKEFSARLAQLRSIHRISARDMSLSLGQNPGYINTIENGKALPTMANFFYICDFLGITPEDFFDMSTESPEKIRELAEQMKQLTANQLDIIAALVEEFSRKNES